MAVSVATFHEDELRKRDTRPPTYRSVESDALKTGIRALVRLWESRSSVSHARCPVSNDARGVVPRELFRPYGSARPRVGVPPTYEESVLDAPPDYTCTDALAMARNFDDSRITASTKVDVGREYRQEVGELLRSQHVKLDLTSSDHIRAHANKKTKKAAKQAQMSKVSNGPV